MPSISVDATWTAEVAANGNKYPNDGTSDWLGDAGANDYRIGMIFDITTLPAAATVTQVDVEFEVSATTHVSTVWVGPYNGDGQADPSADDGTTMWSRCDVSTDNYVSGSTSFNSTGTKTFPNLGSTANADVEAARDAGTTFSIALRGAAEGVGSAYAELDEYTGTNPPNLTITYSSGATLTDVNLVALTGIAQASLSSLRWSWFDSTTPSSFSAPTDQGTAESTDGSGNITLAMASSALTTGQEGTLVLSNSGGTIIGAYRLAVD